MGKFVSVGGYYDRYLSATAGAGLQNLLLAGSVAQYSPVFPLIVGPKGPLTPAAGLFLLQVAVNNDETRGKTGGK